MVNRHDRVTGAMIAAVVVLAVGGGAGVAVADPDPAAAAVHNRDGLAALKRRELPAAIAAFERAIEADPDHVLAHYNLACAASRAEDAERALVALGWVGNRAVYDAGARKAAKQAAKDRDLAWLFANHDEAATEAATPSVPRTDLLAEHDGATLASIGNERATIGPRMAAVPGAHAATCDPAHAGQGAILSIDTYVVEGVSSSQDVSVSMRDGVVIFGPSGAYLVRSEPLGCSAPRAAGDRLVSARLGQARQLAVVVARGATEKAAVQEVVVFQVKKDAVAKIFAAPIAGAGGKPRGALVSTPRGDLIYTAPGGKPVVHAWDGARFVERGAPK